jgi:hypothetical protein
MKAMVSAGARYRLLPGQSVLSSSLLKLKSDREPTDSLRQPTRRMTPLAKYCIRRVPNTRLGCRHAAMSPLNSIRYASSF